MQTTNQNLGDRIQKSVSPFHTVGCVEEELTAAGFETLHLQDEWKLVSGGHYVVTLYDSTLFAFVVGTTMDAEPIRIATAHTDFPGFRIKPSCEIHENGYAKCNVEVYGGPILNTWLDRPLSIAGKVVLRPNSADGTEGSAWKPVVRLLDMKRPVLCIPNLAIHMNRDVNKGVELNRQKDMLPVMGLWSKDTAEGESNDSFLAMLASQLSCKMEDILDYELYTYSTEPVTELGISDEFLTGPRLDNITSVAACVHALEADTATQGLHVIALFDNEEIGSKTKQGAGSVVLSTLLERIYEGLGIPTQKLKTDLFGGFMMSVDVAHGIHPNVPEKNDPTNQVLLNHGVVLKIAANQAYASDSEAVATAMLLAEQAGVPYQKFVNRSDGTSGSTLGSISSTGIPMRTLDIGVPLLAMHSAREMMGSLDQGYLETFLTEFFGGR